MKNEKLNSRQKRLVVRPFFILHSALGSRSDRHPAGARWRDTYLLGKAEDL